MSHSQPLSVTSDPLRTPDARWQEAHRLATHSLRRVAASDDALVQDAARYLRCCRNHNPATAAAHFPRIASAVAIWNDPATHETLQMLTLADCADEESARRLKAWPATLESDDAHASPEVAENAALGDLIDELAQTGRGVILTMGKGGVGNTTIAGAVAVALAERGFPVTLSTTDPAAHVAAAIKTAIPNLRVSRIDPAAEIAAFSAEVLPTTGKELDEAGRALLAEDLRSPCTEEIAVFRAFARTVDEGQEGFVVLDTAPTGHTILLLDAALAYHREVARQSMQIPSEVETLLPRLRDPEFTRVLLVTLPEATPVHEAPQLQSDWRRAGIELFAWIVNQALTNQVLRDPVLRSRQCEQKAFLREVEEKFSCRTAIVDWQVQAHGRTHAAVQQGAK